MWLPVTPLELIGRFRIHRKPHIPPLLACCPLLDDLFSLEAVHSSCYLYIVFQLNTGAGGHLLSAPTGTQDGIRTHKQNCQQFLRLSSVPFEYLRKYKPNVTYHRQRSARLPSPPSSVTFSLLAGIASQKRVPAGTPPITGPASFCDLITLHPPMGTPCILPFVWLTVPPPSQPSGMDFCCRLYPAFEQQ